MEIELRVDYSQPEGSFLASALTEEGLKALGIGNGENPSLIIAAVFETAWTSWEEGETRLASADGYTGFLPLSRTCMVPRAQVTERKTNIPLEEALALVNGTGGRIALVPLKDLGPPYTALKVNGLDAEDPRYPLVLLKGVRFECKKAGGGTLTRRERSFLQKKAAALEKLAVRRLEEARTGEAGPPVMEERPRLYRIATGGDAMLGRGTEKILLTEGPDAVLGGTAELVRKADLALVNMEGVLTKRGDEIKKTYTFRFDPRCAGILKDSGFDAVLLANNHVFDFGITGFLDTLEHLEKADLAVLGAGRDVEAAARPFTTGEGRVQVFGIASFGRERNGWDGLSAAAGRDAPGMLHAGKEGAARIKAWLRKDGEGLDIVFFHGGVEYSEGPDGPTRALYTDLIAAGADLVIGSHPHVEQGFEWVLGKPVFWSLGDYVFDEMDDTPGGDMGLFIVLSYAGNRLVYLEPYPVKMNGPRTVIAGDRQLDRFYRLTKEEER